MTKNFSNSCNLAWDKIAPTWPLKNVIACNPLLGLENLKFESAIKNAAKIFQTQTLPDKLQKINQITIKWCQVFFDQGQATIKMPNRDKGFYQAWKEMAIFDDEITDNKKSNIDFIDKLPNQSQQAINEILAKMNLNSQQAEEFCTLMLSTLNGWSALVKYLGDWSYEKNEEIKTDYLAIRLTITYILWQQAGDELLRWFQNQEEDKTYKKKLEEIYDNEAKQQENLFKNILKNKNFTKNNNDVFDAQIVFCIDVRSEPFRKALEYCGNYETFGFAGFFGIPTNITTAISDESYASCPVLLTPKHNVQEKTICSQQHHQKQLKGHLLINEIKKFYQSLKYNFTTPLPLAEGMGIWSGSWMLTRTVAPKSKKLIQKQFSKILKQNFQSAPDISSIPFEDQVSYSLGALRAIGLIENFSEIVVFCGHGSQSENNTFATALDCGACGGRHGDSNAKILAQILNQENIRKELAKNGVDIPSKTIFYAAKHNTTTDEVEIYLPNDKESENLVKLKNKLLEAKKINNLFRAKNMEFVAKKEQSTLSRMTNFFFKKSHTWSETRPEWGLAKNCFFIAAPRKLTANLNLRGRAFLHSYDFEIDNDNTILSLILNAPMVVAQWINSQYLFSTLDNVSYGAGSKITQNIVGKFGVMQGNASDLMHGLPLQSVYKNDQKAYHVAMRLTTLVYTPTNKVDSVIATSAKLQQLFANNWVMLYCLDPRDNQIYALQSDLTWKRYAN